MTGVAWGLAVLALSMMCGILVYVAVMSVEDPRDENIREEHDRWRHH